MTADRALDRPDAGAVRAAVPEPTDSTLPGGTANRGMVRRRGETVRRPSGEHSPAVHSFLDHLARQGFDGAPRVLGQDGSVEILSYLPGVAAHAPTPEWALTADALAGVGELLRRLHESAVGFDGSGCRWQRPIPRRWQGPLITHNDPNPGNVIFCGDRVTALIDFDLAGPGSVEWELALAACFWVPFWDPVDVLDARAGATGARLQVLLDGYGATDTQRAGVLAASVDASRWIADTIADAAALGHPAFSRLWAEEGARCTRATRWLQRVQPQLRAEATGRRVSVV